MYRGNKGLLVLLLMFLLLMMTNCGGGGSISELKTCPQFPFFDTTKTCAEFGPDGTVFNERFSYIPEGINTDMMLVVILVKECNDWACVNADHGASF